MSDNSWVTIDLGDSSEEEDRQEEDRGGWSCDQDDERTLCPSGTEEEAEEEEAPTSLGLGGATKAFPRVRVSFHTRKYPRRCARKNMSTLTPDFKYVSLSVWALEYHSVVSSSGRKLTIVSRPKSPISGTGKWFNPYKIE